MQQFDREKKKQKLQRFAKYPWPTSRCLFAVWTSNEFLRGTTIRPRAIHGKRKTSDRKRATGGWARKKSKKRKKKRRGRFIPLVSARPIPAIDFPAACLSRPDSARRKNVPFLYKTNRSLSLSLTLSNCIVFYLRRATDTIAERRGLPLLTLNLALLVRTTSSKPNAPFYCECHTGNLEIYLLHHISLPFFDKVYCQKPNIHENNLYAKKIIKWIYIFWYLALKFRRF